jgi:hypothetical protein
MPAADATPQAWWMTETSETESQPADDQPQHDGHHPRSGGAGIDLPVVGHLPYQSVAFVAGLGIAGAAGVIDWPVVAAVGLGYALARR